MYYLVLILLFFSVMGCENAAPVKEVSPILETKTDSYDSYFERGGGNIIDKLYKELVQKTPALKQFELKVDSFERKKPIVTDNFQNYNEKSERYYGAALVQSNSLKDSMLRKAVKLLIEKSQSNYQQQTQEWRHLLQQLNVKEIELHDYYNLLKISSTLPLLETYQKESLPPIQEIKTLLEQQAVLQRQLDSLLKKK